MKDKDILDMIGLNDRTITLTADDEYLQIMLEKKNIYYEFLKLFIQIKNKNIPIIKKIYPAF